MSILFVFTSVDRNLKGGESGWYLPEAAHPYYVLAPHFNIDFASPKGINPPVDPVSVKNYTDEQSVEFLKDPIVKEKFASAKKLTEVAAEDYDAVFYVGGYAPVIDVASDPVNAKLASDFYNAGKVTAAVCHGPAALVGATKTDGQPIYAGKKFTGFSNAEEEIAGTADTVPFLLEDKIQSLGGIFEKAEPWQPHVVVDGHLITGQNPASALPIGEAILKALKK